MTISYPLIPVKLHTQFTKIMSITLFCNNLAMSLHATRCNPMQLNA